MRNRYTGVSNPAGQYNTTGPHYYDRHSVQCRDNSMKGTSSTPVTHHASGDIAARPPLATSPPAVIRERGKRQHMEDGKRLDRKTVVVLVGFVVILLLTAVIVSLTFSLELLVSASKPPAVYASLPGAAEVALYGSLLQPYHSPLVVGECPQCTVGYCCLPPQTCLSQSSRTLSER